MHLSKARLADRLVHRLILPIEEEVSYYNLLDHFLSLAVKLYQMEPLQARR